MLNAKDLQEFNLTPPSPLKVEFKDGLFFKANISEQITKNRPGLGSRASAATKPQI